VLEVPCPPNKAEGLGFAEVSNTESPLAAAVLLTPNKGVFAAPWPKTLPLLAKTFPLPKTGGFFVATGAESAVVPATSPLLVAVEEEVLTAKSADFVVVFGSVTSDETALALSPKPPKVNALGTTESAGVESFGLVAGAPNPAIADGAFEGIGGWAAAADAGLGFAAGAPNPAIADGAFEGIGG
jgi:hypothetical protein